MARRTVGPRRTGPRRYVRATRIIGALSLLVLLGAIAWDFASDGFWFRHTLLSGLVASSIVVVATAGAEAVGNTPRFAAAMDEVLASPERREELHRLILRLLAHGHEALGRWADVMVNSGTYAEIVDRHVELYSRLYWWGSVLDESEPLEEQLGPRLGFVSPATQVSGCPIHREPPRRNSGSQSDRDCSMRSCLPPAGSTSAFRPRSSSSR